MTSIFIWGIIYLITFHSPVYNIFIGVIDNYFRGRMYMNCHENMLKENEQKLSRLLF